VAVHVDLRRFWNSRQPWSNRIAPYFWLVSVMKYLAAWQSTHFSSPSHTLMSLVVFRDQAARQAFRIVMAGAGMAFEAGLLGGSADFLRHDLESSACTET
jgi:hypothetical protein